MKQLLYRLPPSLVKDYLVKFNSRQMGREEVCQALGISKTRLYEIRTEWLRDSERFTLEASGGDHACAWPPECAATALSLIGAAGDDGVNFALISDELARRHGFAKTRTAVMRYCKREWPLLVARPNRRGPKAVKRWQVGSAGELWQHDSTPVHVWGEAGDKQYLILTVDDATRQMVGGALCERETIREHFTLFRRLFERTGVPRCVYTDGFTMFGHEGEDIKTRCGRMFRGLGIEHRIAPSPQAKGKIERSMRTFQHRLATVLREMGVRSCPGAQPVIDDHLRHWNGAHINGTTGLIPDSAYAECVAKGLVLYAQTPPPHMLDLHISSQERRSVSGGNTVAFDGRKWVIGDTLRKHVWLVIHDHQFWVVEEEPSPLMTRWPKKLGHFRL